MSKTSKGKKIAIGLVVGVLATTAIVCAAVPQVRESIKDLISKIKGEQTPEEKDNTRKEKTHDDDHYQNLTDDEKKEFDDKLNNIIDSDYYKNLDDDGKDDLIDKFVESEKTIKDVSKDPKDKKPADIQTKIEDKQSELESVKKELEELKNSGASEEEIAKSEERQQQIEDQIKSAEQEKAYWETVATVKDTVSTNDLFCARNPGTTIRRINEIYSRARTAYFNIDVVKEEVIDGKSYFSRANQYCIINNCYLENKTYEEIINMIAASISVNVDKTCVNINSESNQKQFEQIKHSFEMLNYLEENGYQLTLVKSWNVLGNDNPEYIVRATYGDDERLFLVVHDDAKNEYYEYRIQKVCPEFWAQLEIEQSQNATPSAEAQAQAEIDEISTRDENGKVTGMDWDEYQEKVEKKKAQNAAKLASQDAAMDHTPLYSDKELSL